MVKLILILNVDVILFLLDTVFSNTIIQNTNVAKKNRIKNIYISN